MINTNTEITSSKLRILLVHNYYQQPGGEDAVFSAEKKLLLSRGHSVEAYTDSNDRLQETNSLIAAKNIVWSSISKKAISAKIEQFKPNVVHFHNTFGVMSPSVYYACSEKGIPIVQTLHNYRLICPNAYLYRDGKPCESCIGKSVPLAGIRHACYRSSMLQTTGVATMLAVHRGLRTWHKVVDRYIALTEFSKEKFVAGGLPRNKISVKPNFLFEDPGSRNKNIVGDYVLFAGRLSEEKGIIDVIEGWKRLADIPLVVAGDGKLFEQLQSQINAHKLKDVVTLVGWVDDQELNKLIRRSRFVLYSSKLYENYPMIIVESRANAVPVVATHQGVAKSLIRNYSDGLFVKPNDKQDFVEKVSWAWEHPDEMRSMGIAARAQFDRENTADENYRILLNIYKEII